MQVAHQNDHITHAVLGGSGNISFGISDDPAFFQILSSALYKDPMLAMVRETICNAWDAHIDAGRTDQPLNITLDDEYLTIRDYGKGIPHDKIGPVYAVYGASTKKNDGRQTGGFGLGCKSPFAYTDHFEVTSCHDGKKTLYRMSKSSAEKAGKPGVITIATFPTTETGITVKIPLKGESGDARLESLIRQVVFNGDIKALHNDVLLPTLGLVNSESGFVLINDQANSDLPTRSLEGARIFVRYGNVIYPVESAEEIRGLYEKVYTMLNRIYRCRLVLVAPPDSISITPSREALTMSEITAQTITSLLSSFLANLMQSRAVSKRYEQMVDGYVDAAAKDPSIPVGAKLNLGNWRLPGIPGSHKAKFLRTTDDFAELEVLLRYGPDSRGLSAKEWLPQIRRYINHMVDNGQLDRGLVQSWFNEARKARNLLQSPAIRSHNGWEYDYGRNVAKRRRCEATIATAWWQRRIALPLVRRMQAASEHVKADKLFYHSGDMMNREYERGTVQVKPITKVRMGNMTNCLTNFIKPTVVVCHSVESITRRLKYVSSLDKEGTFQFGDYFVLQVPKGKGIPEATIAALNQVKNLEVLDLTGRLPHEQEAYEERLAADRKRREKFRADNPQLGVTATTPIPKKSRPGLVRMDALIEGDKIDTTKLVTVYDPTRITEPKFIAKVSTAADHHHDSDQFGPEMTAAIAKLWGTEGAVTNNSGVYDRHIKKGIMDISAFVVDKVINELATNPQLKAHMACDAQHAEDYLRLNTGYHQANQFTELYKMLLTVPGLETLIPGYTPLSEENQLRLIVWSHITRQHPWVGKKEVQDAAADINGIPLSPDVAKFLQGLIANPFLGFIDMSGLKNAFIAQRDDPANMQKLVSIIQFIIK